MIPPVFHDIVDDGLNNARWALQTLHLRHCVLDVSNTSAWAKTSTNPYTNSIMLLATGENVYAFCLKDYIRPMTTNSPFTELYDHQVPSFVSGTHIHGAEATGQSGTSTFNVTLAANDLAGVDPQSIQTIMVGLKPSGGTPTLIGFQTSYVDGNPYATAPMPSDVVMVAGDLLLVQVAIREPNGIRSIATPPGWTLLQWSPTRMDDPTNAGQVDQLIYMRTAGQEVLAFDGVTVRA